VITTPTPRCARRAAFSLAATALLLLVHPASQCAALPGYNVAPGQVTVSGISSGAYMAVQIAVAHSATVKGVAAIAGGPYACAQGSATTATRTCMVGTPDAKALADAAKRAAAAGQIDPLAHLATQKAWFFNGINDGVVKRPVSDALFDFYKHFDSADNLFYKTNLPAAHSQVTLGYGQACSLNGGDFMNNCGYDAAGMLLQHLLGGLRPRAKGALEGRIVAFSQAEFVLGAPGLSGLSHEGFAYVPKHCAAQRPCRLHIALHGCKQHATLIDDHYYAHAGYNEWADTNDLIVLYPQTVATTLAPLNPNGCWDWWGYVDENYANRSSVQIRAIRAMAQRIGSRHEAAAGLPGPTAAPRLKALDASDTRVALAWSPAPAAQGFNVYRADCARCSFTRLNKTRVSGASFGDHGLTPRTAYIYKLRAVNAAGAEGPESNAATITTTAAPPACDPYQRDNLSHWMEGRADMVFGVLSAKGSQQPMGLGTPLVETTLNQVRPGYFVIGACP
jgi:poly(3-hydroxybutyrate) depolymerase